MPSSPICCTLSAYWSTRRSRVGRPSLMSSCTGMLSTTESARPASSTAATSCSRRALGHASPTGTSYSALTTPVTPGICLMCFSGMGSSAPNHPNVMIMICGKGLAPSGVWRQELLADGREHVDERAALQRTNTVGLIRLGVECVACAQLPLLVPDGDEEPAQGDEGRLAMRMLMDAADGVLLELDADDHEVATVAEYLAFDAVRHDFPSDFLRAAEGVLVTHPRCS